MAIPGVKQVDIKMTSQVRASKSEQKDKLVPLVKNIVPVASGKGGVGKSTVSANLAVALAKMGCKVGLMDADVYGPSIPTLTGAVPASGGNPNRFVPPIAHGVKVVSMGFFVNPGDAVIWRGPMLHKAVEQFLGQVEWGELDYLIVDLPPGTGDVSLSMAQSVPVAGAVVVTTPQGVSVSDVRKAVAMFRQLNIPVLGVVENMSYFVCGHCQERTEIFGHGGGAKMAEDMGIPLLGQIPIDTRVRAGGDEGRPIVSAAPESPAAKAFAEVAGRVAAEISKQNARVLKVIQTA
jgi:ATP-binding protein involved in chromosome partitioning